MSMWLKLHLRWESRLLHFINTLKVSRIFLISSPPHTRGFSRVRLHKYCVEDLNVPSLVFQSEDDRLSDYDKAVAGAYRLPECTFVSFKNGGHLLEGHDNEIRAVVCEFCKK